MNDQSLNNAEMMLKVLDPILDINGGVKNTEVIPDLLKFMKDNGDKFLHKCLIINILNATDSKNILSRFIHEGECWNMLNYWIKNAKQKKNGPLLLELLTLFVKLPVSILLLKKNDTAKTIKQLTKLEWNCDEKDKLKSLASDIVNDWMQLVQLSKTELGKTNNLPPPILTTTMTMTTSNGRKEIPKQPDSNNFLSAEAHQSQLTKGFSNVTISNDLFVKAERRPKTVKPYQAKFRSIGFDTVTCPSENVMKTQSLTHPSKDASKSLLKRNSDSSTGTSHFSKKTKVKSDQLNDSTNTAAISTTTSSPTSIPKVLDVVSSQSPQPPILSPALVFKESCGFINALDVVVKQPVGSSVLTKSKGIKANSPSRKCSSSTDPSNSGVEFYPDSTSNDKLNEPSPDINNEQTCALVKEPEQMETHEHMEEPEPTNNSELANDHDIQLPLEIEEMINKDMENCSNAVSGEMLAPENSAFDPSVAMMTPKCNSVKVKSILSKLRTHSSDKKLVKWKKETDLFSYYFFEMDESERGYFNPVNYTLDDEDIQDNDAFPPSLISLAPPPPPPDDGHEENLTEVTAETKKDDHHAAFMRMKKNELALERKAMAQAKKKHLAQNGITLTPWRPPMLIDGLVNLVPQPGMKSREKRVKRFDFLNETDLQNVLGPTLIPIENVSNPLAVMEYKHLQLPSGKSVSKKNETSPNLPANHLIGINPTPSLFGGMTLSSPVPLGNYNSVNLVGGNIPADYYNLTNTSSDSTLVSERISPLTPPNFPVVQYLKQNILGPQAPPNVLPFNTAMMNNPNMVYANKASSQALMMNRLMHLQNVQPLNNVQTTNMFPKQQNQLAQNHNYLQPNNPSGHMQYQMPNPTANDKSKINYTHKRICRHFISAKGCRFGSACSFLHIKENAATGKSSTSKIYSNSSNSSHTEK